MLTRIFLVMLLSVGIAGCATTRSKTPADQLQSRLTELEKKLEEKDSEIVDLQYQVKDLSSKVDTGSTGSFAADRSESTDVLTAVAPSSDGLIRVNVSAEKVQRALKNSGYYSGKVDGKVGPGTKAAIVAFQKAQGLTADGVIGKRTWEALKKNLN